MNKQFNLKSLTKARIVSIFIFLYFFTFFGTIKLRAQDTSPQFVQGRDTLVVYKDVPGLSPSNKYKIRVRSAATNNEWVDCFAHYTYNKASELPDDGVDMLTTNYNYQIFTDKWSQTYANFEMSKNSSVEVEISTIPGFKVQDKDLQKVTAHPAHRVSVQPEIREGNIYFTMSNPGQVVIDINGQMDDFNKAIDDISPNKSYVTHTLAIFANPMFKKPAINEPRVYVVEAGVMPTTDSSSYDLMYFKPGVHDIGRNFKVYPGKKYFIPGDAIVYGTFNNYGVPTGIFRCNGENIKVYGLGTISGERITHPNYLPESPDHTEFKSFTIENGFNVEINGITIIDPANHSVNLNAWGLRPDKMKEVTFARWVKVISWRANGDGIGSSQLVEDCYLHTADDASYIKGNRRRIVFWKDANAAMFNMSSIPEIGTSFPIIIEDCDVIYNRTRGVSGGGVFVQRSEGTPGQRYVDVTVRNFRVTDPRSNMPTFYLVSKNIDIGSSYSGLIFQNITVTNPIFGGRKNEIIGCLEAPWYGGITLDNVSIAGELLTEPVFLRDFTNNEFVKDIFFKNSQNFNLTINNPSRGFIISNPSLDNYIDGTTITLTAIPKMGYEFKGWSRDVSGTTNPLTIVMSSDKIVSAIFEKATTFVFETPGMGSWTVPEGVTNITLKSWGGGGAGGSAYSGLATTNTQVRGGGGAGGSFAGITIDVTPGQIVNYTIGAGGIGAEPGFTDLTGGESGGSSFASVNNTTIISAFGGSGGINRSLTNLILSGLGGVAPTTGNIGNIVFYGGNGGNGGPTGPGGGGGSAGNQGNGGNAINQIGGAAGNDEGAAGATGINSTLPGDNGMSPGAGGAGAAVRNNTPYSSNNVHKTGGSGANGKLMIIINQDLSVKDVNLVDFANVALNKTATASSSYSTYVPSGALDGNLVDTASAWWLNFGVMEGSNYTPLPAWLEIDLQGSFIIDSMKITEEIKALKNFTFEAWNDTTSSWATILNITENQDTSLTTYKTFTALTTTKVRLNITAHNSTDYVKLLELQIYGVPNTPTWTGATSSVWTVGTNWSTGTSPNQDSNVTIANGATYQPIILTNVAINTLTIDAEATLQVTGPNLTVTGAITNSGTMTLSNNSNLIQGGSTNTNTGNITVNRNSNLLKRLDYTIWSSPVTNSALSLKTFSPETLDNRFYNYNETNNLYNVIASPGTTPFTTGAGYLIRMPDIHLGYPDAITYIGIFTGVPNNGTISKAITFNGTAPFGYNMVGNPYPSTLDADAFIDANATFIESSLYFWRKVNAALGSAYAVYTKAGATTATPSSALPNGKIQVGQGFFVKAKSGATSISFANAMRVANNDNQFFKAKQVVKDRVWLNVSNTSGAFGQTLVGYFAEATSGVDEFDAKYINDSPVALTSIINNEEFTIQGRPTFDPIDVVALNFKTNVAGNYTIALDHFDGVFDKGQNVYLVDTKTGIETDLKTTSYIFTALAETYNTRFYLKYQKTLKTDAPTFNENTVRVYKNNGVIYVNSGVVAINNIKVYDLIGRLIAEQKNVKSTTAVLKDLKVGYQVLIVKITSEEKNVVTKKIVN